MVEAEQKQMRSYELTHPHNITITIDPVDFHDFQRLTQDSETVRLISVERDPDLWTLHVACASDEVARRMEQGWT